MTTEVIEATSTEIPEETQATLPDTQADSTPEVPAESTEPTVDVLESFVKERGLDTEAEATATGTEPETQEPDARVLAEAQRIAEATRQAELRQREEEGIHNAFINRAGGIRNFLLNKGLDPLDADRVVQEFNAHHGQSGTVHRREAIAEAGKNFTQTLYSAAEKELPGVTKGDYSSTDSFMKAVVMQARKGYVSEKDVKTRVKSELSEFKRHLEDKKLLVTSKAPPGETGAAFSGKRLADYTPDELGTMPIDQLMKLT
jgi:hypothetical protein